jgi:hypothetical protein
MVYTNAPNTGPRAIQRAFGAVVESEDLLLAFTASVKTLSECSAHMSDDTIMPVHRELVNVTRQIRKR